MLGRAGSPPLSHPLIVLTDVRMPVLNGFGLIDAMREEPSLRDLSIFVMTCSDSDEDRAAALRRGVVGFVQKGSSPDAFERLAALMISRCASLKPPSSHVRGT